MTGLLLLVSLLGLVPSMSQALNVSIESALLVRGEPVGFRYKRAETLNEATNCTAAQYKPKRKNFCCNKCVPGTIVAKDCQRQGEATTCISCETGTFMDVPNYSRGCRTCRTCLHQLGQIELSNCTQDRDAVCGCPDGYFKQIKGTEFVCEECNRCENGRVLLKCHDDKDTFCDCLHNFFLDKETRMCYPCTECSSPDCQGHCPQSVEKPDEFNVGLIVFGASCAVALLVATSFIIWMNRKRIKSYVQTTSDGLLQKKTSPPLPVIEGTIVQTPLIQSNGTTPTSKQELLPGYTRCAVDNPYVVQQNAHISEPPVLPDVTIQTDTPSIYTPSVRYTIIQCIPVNRWREFVRRLGLIDHTIDTALQDNRYFKDAQYAMLDIWINSLGTSGATRDCLFRVLREMDLSGCAEKIEASF